MIIFYLIENFTYVLSIIANVFGAFDKDSIAGNVFNFLSDLEQGTGIRIIVLSLGFLFFKISDDELAGIQKLEIHEMQSIN